MVCGWDDNKECGFGGPTEASLLAVPAVCWPEATRGRRRGWWVMPHRGVGDTALQRLLLWTGKLQERSRGSQMSSAHLRRDGLTTTGRGDV